MGYRQVYDSVLEHQRRQYVGLRILHEMVTMTKVIWQKAESLLVCIRQVAA